MKKLNAAFWLIELAFVVCILGCGKQALPEMKELIQKSSAIYLAESREGGYYVQQILKLTPANPPAIVSGQEVHLNRQILGYEPPESKRIVVFFEREEQDAKRGIHLIQKEVPLLGGGKLTGYRMTYDELVRLINDKSD